MSIHTEAVKKHSFTHTVYEIVVKKVSISSSKKVDTGEKQKGLTTAEK